MGISVNGPRHVESTLRWTRPADGLPERAGQYLIAERMPGGRAAIRYYAAVSWDWGGPMIRAAAAVGMAWAEIPPFPLAEFDSGHFGWTMG